MSLKLKHDKELLLWSKEPFLQQLNEEWDKRRNEMQLVYSAAGIESEITAATVHSSQMQFEGRSQSLQVLSDFTTCLGAEKRLSLAIKCLHVLLNDP